MGALQGVRVLVIEDEALIAMLIEDALSAEGAEVVGVAGRVADGRTAAEARAIDAAVIDMNLAGQSSVPVMEVLRRRGVPFLVVSGYGNGISAAAGEAPILAKPFEAMSLVAAIARLARAGDVAHARG